MDDSTTSDNERQISDSILSVERSNRNSDARFLCLLRNELFHEVDGDLVCRNTRISKDEGVSLGEDHEIEDGKASDTKMLVISFAAMVFVGLGNKVFRHDICM